MVHKKVKMDASIIEVLEKDSFDNFSIPQLKDEYMKRCHYKTPRQARVYVYKQVVKLVTLGWLLKNGEKHSRNATYRKTALFGEVILSKKNQVVLEDLKSKLQEYKSDMISIESESKEYLKLARSYPSMGLDVKAQHALTSKKASKLLGKINALNTMIALHEG